MIDPIPAINNFFSRALLPFVLLNVFNCSMSILIPHSKMKIPETINKIGKKEAYVFGSISIFKDSINIWSY
jgi:hypothetical protein